jgi:hypothetical protein
MIFLGIFAMMAAEVEAEAEVEVEAEAEMMEVA